MEQPTGEGLLRAIRRWDLVALTINAVIGGGIFGLPSEVFARVGVYSLLAFVVCGAAVILIVLCFAEVGSRFSDTGGPYLYARAAFGPLIGFEVGWMIWIARLTGFAANCNLLVAYLAFFFPGVATDGGRPLTVCAVVLVLTIVNVIGVHDAAVLSNVSTVAKVVPLALLVAAGLFFIDPARYAQATLPTFSAFSVSVLLLVYAFTGFEMAVIPGGEQRDPTNDLPYALLVGLGVVIVFYLLIQLVVVGTVPELGSSSRPLSDAGARVLGPYGAAIISAGALISLFGNLNVIMLVAPRLPFAMAERGELPRRIAATHPRFHTPHFAIVLTAVIVLVLTLSGTFIYAATVSVLARLFGYATSCAALPVLRRTPGAAPARFTAPAGNIVCITALLLVAWLVTNATAAQARDAGIAALLGLLIYAASARKSRIPKGTA